MKIAVCIKRVPVMDVRATDDNGKVQTSVVADVLPDGASGWHEVHFNAV